MGRSGTRARVGLAVVALALGSGFAACGDDDADAFKEDYNAAVKPLSELNSDIGGSIGSAPGKSNEAIAEEFDQLADKARETRRNLADLKPPEDAKEAYDELLTALEGGTDDLRAVAEAARDSDPRAAGRASEDLVAAGEEIQEAETALQRAVDG